MFAQTITPVFGDPVKWILDRVSYPAQAIEKDITRYEYSDWLKNLRVAKSEFSVSLRLKYLTFSDILVIYQTNEVKGVVFC